MTTKARSAFLVLVAFALLAPLLGERGQRTVRLVPGYDHDRWNVKPKDVLRFFEAYVTSFDGPDDDDGDGKRDLRGVPEWVSYEIHRYTNRMPKHSRPPWFSDDELVAAGIAPTDASYNYGKRFREIHPDSPVLGYDRGHMCMKNIASRLGADADWNTHTMLNCVPQKSAFNEGIWLDLEMRTERWADRYGAIWVICGPVFSNRKPSLWLGEEGEFKVAVPDACFKIVVRTNGDSSLPRVLSLIYPQSVVRRKGGYRHEPYFSSVAEVERATGLAFFSDFPKTSEVSNWKATRTSALWPSGFRAGTDEDE